MKITEHEKKYIVFTIYNSICKGILMGSDKKHTREELEELAEKAIKLAEKTLKEIAEIENK